MDETPITRSPDGSYRTPDGRTITYDAHRPPGGVMIREWVMRDREGRRLAAAKRLGELVKAQRLRFSKSV